MKHERLSIEPDWVDFDWWMVRCACGWYARRPTRQRCKREYHHHVAFAYRQRVAA